MWYKSLTNVAHITIHIQVLLFKVHNWTRNQEKRKLQKKSCGTKYLPPRKRVCKFWYQVAYKNYTHNHLGAHTLVSDNFSNSKVGLKILKKQDFEKKTIGSMKYLFPKLTFKLYWYQSADNYGTHKHKGALTRITSTSSKSKNGLNIE